MKQVNIWITGKRVHGVFFRVSIKEKANELGVKGFVSNEDDGSVYVEAEGGEGKLNQLVEWCRKGPRLAQVDGVKIEWAEPRGYEGFLVV